MEVKTITACVVAFTTLIGLGVTGWTKLADIQGQLDTIAAYDSRIEVIEDNSANALLEIEKRLEQAIADSDERLARQLDAMRDKLQTITEQAIQTAGKIGSLESKVEKMIEDAIKQYNTDTRNPLAI